MKIIRLVVILIALVIAYYVASPYIPLGVGVKNLTPVRTAGNDLTLDISLKNYTLQPKELYLGTSDLAAAVSLYIDDDTPPPTKPADKETAITVLTIPPLGTKTIAISNRVTASGDSRPMIIAGNSGTLPLSEGKHTYVVSVGGYTSGKQSLNIQW